MTNTRWIRFPWLSCAVVAALAFGAWQLWSRIEIRPVVAPREAARSVRVAHVALLSRPSPTAVLVAPSPLAMPVPALPDAMAPLALVTSPATGGAAPAAPPAPITVAGAREEAWAGPEARSVSAAGAWRFITLARQRVGALDLPRASDFVVSVRFDAWGSPESVEITGGDPDARAAIRASVLRSLRMEPPPPDLPQPVEFRIGAMVKTAHPLS